MLLPDRVQYLESPIDSADAEFAQIPPHYRNWRISTKFLNGKVWLRWQHPQENFPRYGCPISEGGVRATVNYVRMFIDLAIKLEEAHKKHL